MNISRLSTVIAGILVVAVLGAGWFFGVSPRLAAAGRSDGERTAVEAQNQMQEAAVASLAADAERLDTVEASLEVLRRQVPATPQLETFLTQIDAAASSSQATVTGYTTGEAVAYNAAPVAVAPAPATDQPATPTPAESVTTDAAAVPSTAAQVPDVSTLGLYYVPVTIEATGSLDQLSAFTAAVQKSPRLFISPTVDLAGAKDGAQPTATLTGYVFALPDTAPGTVPAATAAPAPGSAPAATG